MVGGSCAAGLSLRSQTIFNTKPEAGWIYQKGPESTFQSKGKRHTPIFASSPNGGTNQECLLEFLQRNFVEVNTEKPWNGAVVHASIDNPIIVICDGHGTHLDLEVLDFCRANGIHLVLHLPHTSHATQVEDVANFGVFKADIRISNENLLTARALANVRNKYKLPYVKLDNSDLMDCVKGPWERAFEKSRCLTGWAMVSVAPFTRRLYWELLEKEQLEKQAVDECEVKAGLDFSSFTLKQISDAMRGPRHVSGERVADVEEGDHEEAGEGDGDGDRLHREILGTRMTSAHQWHKGAVTGDEAYESVKAWVTRRHEKDDREAANAAERKEAADAELLLAAGAPEQVKQVVRAHGWGTGRGAALTKEMMIQVFVWFGKPKQSSNNLATQVARCQECLGWKDGRFPDDPPPAPAPPPPPP